MRTQRALLALLGCAALVVTAAQGLTGVSQLALYAAPFLLLLGLLLSGRFIGEEVDPRPPRRGPRRRARVRCRAAGRRCRSARSPRCSSAARAWSAGRRAGSPPSPDAPSHRNPSTRSRQRRSRLRTLTCVAGVAALLIGAPAALAHQGNPHYRSVVTPGHARRARAVAVGAQLRRPPAAAQHQRQGRHGHGLPEQAVRPLAGRTARSRSTRTRRPTTSTSTASARSPCPKGLGAQPKWKVVSRDGRYDWHDHRIHWMSQSDPPGLKDKSQRQQIDDWTVPISVAGRKGAIKGSLTWVPLPNAPLPRGRDLRVRRRWSSCC